MVFFIFPTPLGELHFNAEAFENLEAWSRWGNGRPNFIGLIAVQWSGNMTDQWLPDFVTAADYAWRSPEAARGFQAQMARVRRALARTPDAANPASDQVDRPAWDGIWLQNGQWEQEIVSGTRGHDRGHYA